MGVCAAATRRDYVVVYMALIELVTLLTYQVNGDSSSCTSAINVPRNVKLSGTRGQTLIVKCPVHTCSQELPNVTWCKIGDGQPNICEPVRPGEGISSEWEQQKGNDAVYVLKIVSVQINDTGYYKCSADYREQQIVGSIIEINISAASIPETISENTESNDTISTTASPSSELDRFKLFLYFVSSLGGLCVIIIAVSLLVFFCHRMKVKRRSSPDPVSAEEVKFVAAPESPKNCPHQLEEESSSPPGTELTAVSIDVTYDNAHLSYKSTKRNAPEAREEEDSIIYADLNHDTKKTDFKFQNDCEVEYAMVHLNKPRKDYYDH